MLKVVSTWKSLTGTSEQFHSKQIFLTAFIFSLGASALAAIFIFLIGDFGDTEVRILLTTLTVGGYSLTGLCSSVLYDKRKYAGLALSGMFVAAIGFLLTVGLIWDILNFEDLWKAVSVCIILSFSIAHSSLLLLAEPDDKLIDFLLLVTIVCIAVVAAMLIYFIIGEFGKLGELYYRLLGILAVLDVAGTVAIPILRRIKA